MDRLPLLRTMAAAKPGDPFPRYGLAMELAKREDDEAVAVFEALITDHPGYVPSYLMFGNLLIKRGDKAGAARVLDRGIDAARAAGDDHALGELQSARAELP